MGFAFFHMKQFSDRAKKGRTEVAVLLCPSRMDRG